MECKKMGNEVDQDVDKELTKEYYLINFNYCCKGEEGRGFAKMPGLGS
jgi:hypothetical protein